jgi:hypothetical protein
MGKKKIKKKNKGGLLVTPKLAQKEVINEKNQKKNKKNNK